MALDIFPAISGHTLIMGIQAFDRKRLRIQQLALREHDLDRSVISEIGAGIPSSENSEITAIARKMIAAKKNRAAIILMMGAHVIRAGVQYYLIDLMERGYIDLIAMNGAGMIHDYEFAMAGATTESVSRYIKNGEFGLWQETGTLNDIINAAYLEDETAGMGQVVGKAIFNSDFGHKDISLLAAAYRLKLPVTVHVSLGQDIIHEHPNCNGAATGALSYNDFLVFASMVQNLESGVLLSFGSAVMAPEVFLKALSMARNIAHQEGSAIRHFSSLVCDLHDLPPRVAEEPPKSDAAYYFRPWKTMLVRTVRDGGDSYYVRGRHHETIPMLWQALKKEKIR